VTLFTTSAPESQFDVLGVWQVDPVAHAIETFQATELELAALWGKRTG
jgi:hypothetical protein